MYTFPLPARHVITLSAHTICCTPPTSLRKSRVIGPPVLLPLFQANQPQAMVSWVTLDFCCCKRWITTLLFIFFVLNWVLQPVKIISIILSWVGRKREIPEKKHLTTCKQNLAHLTWPELGSNLQRWDDGLFWALKISILNHLATGAASTLLRHWHWCHFALQKSKMMVSMLADTLVSLSNIKAILPLWN